MGFRGMYKGRRLGPMSGARSRGIKLCGLIIAAIPGTASGELSAETFVSSAGPYWRRSRAEAWSLRSGGDRSHPRTTGSCHPRRGGACRWASPPWRSLEDAVGIPAVAELVERVAVPAAVPETASFFCRVHLEKMIWVPQFGCANGGLIEWGFGVCARVCGWV